jgi:hypothetical protein
MNSSDFLSQIGAIRWLIDDNSDNTQLLKLFIAGRLACNVYDRLTNTSQIDALKSNVHANIAEYIDKHPRATEDELVAVVRKELDTFRTAVSLL